MKANRHYKSKNELEIMGTKIKTQACGRVKIEFLIDARHILLAITCLTEEDKLKPSRKLIEERLKGELFIRGESWYLSPIDYDEEGEHYNLREELKKAVPIAKKFFPKFMNVPNSIKFIKDLD